MVVTIIVSTILGRVFFKIFIILTFFHDNNGPIPITRIAGTIIGTTVEL